MPSANVSPRRPTQGLTQIGLVALALGVTAGLVARNWSPPGLEAISLALDITIRAWTNAFRLLVLPLIVSLLYVAVAGRANSISRGRRIAFFTPIVFVGLFTVVATFTLVSTRYVMTLPWLDRLSLPAPAVDAPPPQAGEVSAGLEAIVDSLVPTNLVAAASTDNLLPLMCLAVVLALASRRLSADLSQHLESLARAVSGVIFVVVEWLVAVTPLLLFAVAFRTARTSGLEFGGVLAAFAGLKIFFLVLGTLLLYPLTSVVGRVSLVRFARAVFPAQVTAAVTRSSLATVPILIQRAGEVLRVPAACTATVIPIAGTTFKLSRAVSDPVLLPFLLHLMGRTITVEQWMVFITSGFVLSLSAPGVPRAMSGVRSIPIYVAVGVPAEYVVLFATSAVVTDVFMTLINTTAYMSATVLVSRFTGADLRDPRLAQSSSRQDPEVGVSLADQASA